MKRIQAKKHKIGTYEIDKIYLSCFDDKRFLLDDGVHTLPYFHKDCDNKKRLVKIKKICHNEKIFVIIMTMIIIMTMTIKLSSIVIEVIRTVFIIIFIL